MRVMPASSAFLACLARAGPSTAVPAVQVKSAMCMPGSMRWLLTFSGYRGFWLLVDRPVRFDGPQLVPAGVGLDFLLGAGLEQLDQAQVLAEGFLRTVGQVHEHGRPHPVQARVRLLEHLDQVGVGAPGDDGRVQRPVQRAEPERIGLGGGLLHPLGELAEPGEVGLAHVLSRLGAGRALKDRQGDHGLFPGRGVHRRDDRSHVRREPHPALGLQAAQGFPDRYRADPQLTGECVDVEPLQRREATRVNPVPEDRIGALLLVHGSSAARSIGHHCLCASEWSAAKPSPVAASAHRRLTSWQAGASTPTASARSAAMPTSFASRPSANPVPYLPVITSCLSTTSVLKLRPVEELTTSTITRGSRPNSLPMASASTAVIYAEAPRKLFSAFIAWPEPSGPVRKIRSPSTLSTGRTCANASSSCPPTMSDSVPASARVIPPDTGASITPMPAGARSSASAFVAIGSDELMSSTTAPGVSAAAIPPAQPRMASRTALSSGSMVTMTSASANDRGEVAGSPPCSAMNRCCAPASLSRTTRGKPAAARLAAMRRPMLPRPTNPTSLGRPPVSTRQTIYDSGPAGRGTPAGWAA